MISGSAVLTHNYISSGSLGLSGGSVFGIFFTYTSSGSLLFGNSASASSNELTYVASGSILLSGNGISQCSNLGLFKENIALSSFIVSSGATFGFQPAAATIAQTVSNVLTPCCTRLISNILYLQNTFSTVNVLNNFLQRNGFTFPNPIVLTYSSLDKKWTSSFNFTGISASSSNKEIWNFIFTFGCLPGGTSPTFSDKNNWEISVKVIKRNLVTNQIAVTNLIIDFGANTVCGSSASFNFVFVLNALTLTTVPGNVKISILSDGIGLFSNTKLISLTKINFQISELTVTPVTPLLNISPEITSL